jgi:peptide-methionine (R)-S-oxide reductase
VQVFPNMSRRGLLKSAVGAFGALLLGGVARVSGAGTADTPAGGVEPFTLPREEWRKRLTPQQYHVLFEEGTERPHSSPLNQEKRGGTFVCAACHLPLFESSTKFESGTGYHCARCGGHQGHVFDDGPPPTGQRWCNNGVALRFVPEGEALPPLVT